MIVRGGKHKFIKSHMLLFSSQPDKIRNGIDKVMDDEKQFCLYLQIQWLLRKKNDMKRYEEVNTFTTKFYMKNNILYKFLNEV